MTEMDILDVSRDMVLLSLLISAPLLGLTLLVGLIISIFQAVTQVNEMTLTFVPKIIVIGLVLLFTLPWILTLLDDYTTELFLNLPYYIR